MKFQVDFYDAIAYGEISEDLARYKKEFDLANIPPLQRRRLSSAAKCAFSLLSSFESIDMPVIFSSYEGEINRCFELETALAKAEPVSPTSFSLSVHNAISSLLSIEAKNHNEILAISSFSPVEDALQAAFLRLNDGYEKVLILAYHESIKQSYFDEKKPSFMLVLVVSKAKNERVLTLKRAKKEKEICGNLLKSFIVNFDPKISKSWQSCSYFSSWDFSYEP